MQQIGLTRSPLIERSGQLSPESLHLVFNQTQEVVIEVNKWFHSRVEVFAKYQ